MPYEIPLCRTPSRRARFQRTYDDDVSTRRAEELLEGAVTLLAEGGARQLTHRGVDREAELPPGSASNVFRTRAALIEAVLQFLTQREERNLSLLLAADPEATSIDADLITRLGAGMIIEALGPSLPYTLARRALLLEARHDAQVARQLLEASQSWWDHVAVLLTAAHAPDPTHRSRWLLAYVDGLISDQLARPQADFDAVAALAPGVTGICSAP